MTFGTLLSSQGTDASFRPFSPGPPGSFPSVFLAFRRFQLYQILFPPPGLPGFGPSDPAASWTGLSPFGCSDFIRSVSAERISVAIRIKESKRLLGNSISFWSEIDTNG
ncbi:hypothetical protein CRV15_17940 [Streptomyces clavuligerus]|nr:hypothetical protein D1794_18585 [Streptomyces clavuligerus]QCS07338.1 hypothetical protein CRV15_17940 [Streptomyces clavuligerus]